MKLERRARLNSAVAGLHVSALCLNLMRDFHCLQHAPPPACVM